MCLRRGAIEPLRNTSWEKLVLNATPERVQEILKARLVTLEEETAQVQRELDEAIGYTEVECTSNCYGKGCGRMTRIRDLVYMATHWYVQPYSCSGGDYWREGDGEFDCPHCGATGCTIARPSRISSDTSAL